MIRQVAPTAQERASYAGLCHAFLVLVFILRDRLEDRRTELL